MDIQKERKAFLEHWHENNLHFDGEEKFQKPAWDAWLAAKAQTIPKGFVLVPTECTDEIAEAIAFSARVCGGVANDVYESIVKAVIEAQEES